MATYCAGNNAIFTHELVQNEDFVRDLQYWLVTKRHVPVYWYDDVTPNDPDFAEAQMKPFDDAKYHNTRTTLHYRQ